MIEFFHSDVIHSVKTVRIRSYSGPYFPAFGLNTDQNNSEYGHFSRSDYFCIFISDPVFKNLCNNTQLLAEVIITRGYYVAFEFIFS